MDCIIGVDSIWNSFRHQSVSLYTVVESRRSACAYSARWLGGGGDGQNEGGVAVGILVTARINSEKGRVTHIQFLDFC